MNDSGAPGRGAERSADSQCATIFLPPFPVDCFSVYIGGTIPRSSSYLRVTCKKRNGASGPSSPRGEISTVRHPTGLRDDDVSLTIAIEISPCKLVVAGNVSHVVMCLLRRRYNNKWCKIAESLTHIFYLRVLPRRDQIARTRPACHEMTSRLFKQLHMCR